VFVVAAQKIDDIDEGSERSFLIGTAHGVAANARRSYARRREVSDESTIEAHVDGTPDPEQRIASKEGLAILDQFLGLLPEDLREVFILYELEGMTMAAMAEALHLPPGTVASRLRRAREEFQEMVKRFRAARPRGRPS
jgi:RNA polymerase sigma-70 factor, ECF subfamily